MYKTIKIFICKHCKVEVTGREDFNPIQGYKHKRGCPRKKLYG